MPGTLIFFTSEFPYGTGETFIENELPFLANTFERIFIVTNNTSGQTSRSIPQNAEVIRLPLQVPVQYKIKSLPGYFTGDIQREIKFIRSDLKLQVTTSVLSTLLGGYAFALYLADAIENIIAKHKIQVQSLVLYSYWMSNTAAGLALYKRRNQSVKTVCRAHGWDVYFERHTPPYLPLRNFIMNGLDYCCCISSNGKEYLEKLADNKSKSNILVSHLGTFNKNGKRSGYNNGKLVIVSCSNIIPLKRIHLIIKSLALLKDISIEWTHFGDGFLEQEVKNTAQEKLGGLANIKYHFAGRRSNADLLNYYAGNNIDLFINLSETEGLPVSLMEAGSFGIPVIATRVGGVSEIIEDGVNGFLLNPAASPEEITQKIRNYYALPVSEKEKMRQNAFEHWRLNYNAENNYKDFIDLLRIVEPVWH